MAIAEKPVLVFVPGAWHPPSCYDVIINTLSSAPYFYPCVAITTPTVGAEPPILTLQHDVDAIRAVTARLVGDGKEILLVMHSYGGLPGSQSCEGLAKSELERQGKKGGLIALIYITAFILPEGAAGATRETLPPIIDVTVSVSTIVSFNLNEALEILQNRQTELWADFKNSDVRVRVTMDAFSTLFQYFTMMWSPHSLLSRSLDSLTIRFPR